ncbi:MAG: hypothetical protein JW927_15575 [Deltaproteobacteria bacterium]|nr:hypothetical protein [Deltaproteobacteria bacterium]
MAADTDPAIAAVIASAGKSPEALVKYVNSRTLPALNRRILRSPAQVLKDGRGNSIERSRLLAALLDAAGHPVRFRCADLDDESASTLIKSAMPASPPAKSWPEDVPLSEPLTEPALLDAVRRHTWVQVLTEGQWQDIDPSFTAAKPAAFDSDERVTFYRFSQTRLPQVELTIEGDRSKRPGEFEELLWWDGVLESISNQPLYIRIYPRITIGGKGEEEGLDPARRLVDPLAGGQPEEEETTHEPVTTWRAEILSNNGILKNADIPAAGPNDDGTLLSLRLRSRIFFNEEDIIEDLRPVSAADSQGHLPIFQRHALLYSTSLINPQELKNRLSVYAPERREKAHADIERLRKELKQEASNKETLLQASLSSEELLGIYSGHFINLAYLALVDPITEELAERLGIYSYLEEPRLIINSLYKGKNGHEEVSLDLRRDKTGAIGLSGQPQRITESFQFSRGVISSVLEGRLITLATGRPALTTATLMKLASQAKIQTRLYSMHEHEYLDELPLPDNVRTMLNETLESGHVVMLPLRPVNFEDIPRWGWWQINPLTRHTIGVLDSGLHQAVIERTLIETKGVLSNEMATVIGAISGAVDTQFAISTMVLKHGELTAEAIQEAKAYMSGIGEALCREVNVEAKVGGSKTLASASIEMEGCFRYEESLEVSAEAGGSVTLMDKGWCEAFQRGFTCASMTILNAYASQQD